MDFKTTKGHQYSYEEMSLINVARPNPLFEDAEWDVINNQDRYLYFNMCDFGMELGEPLLITGGDRVDIIDGKTGSILFRDCGDHDGFRLISPQSMHHKIGSWVGGPGLLVSEEQLSKISDRSPCCLFRNVVFTNGIVDMVVGRFLCPITQSNDKARLTAAGDKTRKSSKTEIWLKSVSYRFSAEIDKLSVKDKSNILFMHPDVEAEDICMDRVSITKSSCPMACTAYCSGQVKQAFERGDSVEAAIIKASFVDHNSWYARTGSYTFEATLTGYKIQTELGKGIPLSHNTGSIDKKTGRFSFETVVVLWASKEDADKEWPTMSLSDLNVELDLTVRNGYAAESLNEMADHFGPAVFKRFLPGNSVRQGGTDKSGSIRRKGDSI